MTESIAWWRQHVLAQRGEHEQPLGSNHQKYGAQFGWNDVSWCVEFGYDMYDDAGVELPVKTASCVVMYDESKKDGLVIPGQQIQTGDSLIRTWEHKDRAHVNPSLTHFQTVVGTHYAAGVKILDLVGGNQGPGVVSDDHVRADDPSIMGGLAFHTLFTHKVKQRHDDRRDPHELPAKKSHTKPTAILSLGSFGRLAEKLQVELQKLRLYRGRVDGAFGPKTLAAVIAFQKQTWPHDRSQWDGVVGPLTWAKLGLNG